MPDLPPARLVLANLDAEAELAELRERAELAERDEVVELAKLTELAELVELAEVAGRAELAAPAERTERQPNGGKPPPRPRQLRGRRSWTPAASAAAAGAATLLRAFCRVGDRLWTPAPVAPDRLADLPGVPRPELASGPVAAQHPAAELLAWCEAPSATALRSAARRIAADGGDPREIGDVGPPHELRHAAPAQDLHEIVWRLPKPRPAVVAAVHHRAFCLELQRQLGRALSGACMVESYGALEAHLAAGAAGAAGGSWVVKAPLSAAGRARAIHHHGHDPSGFANPAFRRRIENLFRRHGPLLFEPWMDRLADFGAAGLLLPAGAVRWVGFHSQRVDARGQFVGLDLKAMGPDLAAVGLAIHGLAGLPPADCEDWLQALGAAAGALARAGYIGPFGVDSWLYRGEDGAARLHPLGEINARVTFGLVARVLVDRLRGPLGLDAGDRVGLAFGRHQPAAGSTPGVGVVPLLLAGAAGEPGAWLEIPAARPR